MRKNLIALVFLGANSFWWTPLCIGNESHDLAPFDTFHSNFGEVLILEEAVFRELFSSNPMPAIDESKKSDTKDGTDYPKLEKQPPEHNLLTQVEPKKTSSISKEASDTFFDPKDKSVITNKVTRKAIVKQPTFPTNSTGSVVVPKKPSSIDGVDYSNMEKQPTEDLSLAQVEPKKIPSISKEASDTFVKSKNKPEDLNNTKEKLSQEVNFPEASFLNADFFEDSLSEAYTLEEDPMGAQRLLQVRNSTFSPSIVGSSSFNYTSNPFKQPKAYKTHNKSTSLDLSLTFNLGLGEYGIGQEVVCVPSLSFIQMRSYMDPIKDYGDKFLKDSSLNTETQIASLSLPFILPNDYSLTFSHTYTAPSTYRGKKEQLMYSNTPKVSFSKNFILESGDTCTFSTGMSYIFSESDTLEEQFRSLSESTGLSFAFLEAITVQAGQSLNDGPANLQDGFGFDLSFSYTKQYGDRLTFIPSISYNSTNFTEATNSNRKDKVYNAGISTNFAFTEWLNLGGLSNFSWKRTSGTEDDALLSFDDFVGGLTLSVNHSF